MMSVMVPITLASTLRKGNSEMLPGVRPLILAMTYPLLPKGHQRRPLLALPLAAGA